MGRSVATTSTKPPSAIKSDIRRVLDRMQVQYRETKTGFECIHLPSIDISSVQPDPSPAPTIRGRHRKQGSGGSAESSPAKSVVRKASKLSFGVGRKDKDGGSQREKELPGRPSGGTAFTQTPSSGSSSFFNVSSTTHTVTGDEPSQQQQRRATMDDTATTPTGVMDDIPRSQSPAAIKTLPPIPRDMASTPTPTLPMPTGEVNRELFEHMGENTLSVRFEINIVKVCFLLCVAQSFTECLVIPCRSLGCHCTVSSSDEQAVTGGSTKCWLVGCSPN